MKSTLIQKKEFDSEPVNNKEKSHGDKVTDFYNKNSKGRL